MVYFSQAYAKLCEDVVESGEAINHDFDGDVVAAGERAIAHLNEARNFWSRFADIAEQTIDTAATVWALNAARDALNQYQQQVFP